MTNLLDCSIQRGVPRGQENWSELQPENQLHYPIIDRGDDNDIYYGDADEDDDGDEHGEEDEDDGDNQGNQARPSHHHNLVGRHT